MDILMVANPTQYEQQVTKHTTLFFTTQEFWKKEELVKQYDSVLWQAFRTHGKYMQIMQRATYFIIAVDNGTYLGSAAVVEIGNIWLIEYVITNPAHTQKGVGSAVMNRIMQEAKKGGIQFGVLNCDPEKNDGQLPKFYGRLGFKKVE